MLSMFCDVQPQLQPQIGSVSACRGTPSQLPTFLPSKSDPRLRDSIPNPTKVGRNDESEIRDRFTAIAEGSAVIE